MAIERIVPGSLEWEAYYANHIFRYQFASEIILNTTVEKLLDAACGVGYGSNYLAGQKEIKKVVANDRSADALKTAKEKFSNPGVIFLQDDCHTLEISGREGPYDIIVSFETLEHLPRPEDFLSSCLKNLTAGGRIIISTPNQLVSSPEVLDWEYHEKEYTATEFSILLESTGFSNIKLYGQQFNLKGKIKNEIRSDLNRLWSNPFARVGKWLQVKLRNNKYEPVLKETIDDFEAVAFENGAACDKLGALGPFVLIAVAEKN